MGVAGRSGPSAPGIGTEGGKTSLCRGARDLHGALAQGVGPGPAEPAGNDPATGARRTALRPRPASMKSSNGGTTASNVLSCKNATSTDQMGLGECFGTCGLVRGSAVAVRRRCDYTRRLVLCSC